MRLASRKKTGFHIKSWLFSFLLRFLMLFYMMINESLTYFEHPAKSGFGTLSSSQFEGHWWKSVQPDRYYKEQSIDSAQRTKIFIFLRPFDWTVMLFYFTESYCKKTAEFICHVDVKCYFLTVQQYANKLIMHDGSNLWESSQPHVPQASMPLDSCSFMSCGICKLSFVNCDCKTY